jgi:Flp pilus assembly protein TadD
VALDPDLGQAHARLGGAIAKQNRPAEAVAYFQRALDLGADSPTLRLGYSAALESLGRDDEAEAQMEAYRNYHRP